MEATAWVKRFGEWGKQEATDIYGGDTVKSLLKTVVNPSDKSVTVLLDGPERTKFWEISRIENNFGEPNRFKAKCGQATTTFTA